MKRGRWAVVVSLAVAGVAIGGQSRFRLIYQLRRAKAELFEGRAEDALARLAPLEQRYPERADLAYLLAVANRRSGHTNAARTHLARASRLGWWSEDLLRQEDMVRFQSGDVAESEPRLAAVLTAGYPDSVALEVYECLVKGYLSDMRLRQALICIDYWVAWRPDDLQPRLLRAEVFNFLRDPAREAAEYREILRIDPDYLKGRMKLGYLLLKANDPRAALEQHQRCRELAPDDSRVLVALAACRRQLGDLPEARELLERALREDIDDTLRAYALSELGQVALSQRAYAEAAEHLREALRLNPSDVALHYPLGVALSRLGHKEEANQLLQLSEKQRALASRFGDVVHSIGRIPESAELRREAGEVALDLGDREEAFRWLLSALRCDRSSAATHQALARYYTQGGKKEMAQKHRAWAEEFGASPTADVSATP